MSTISPAPPLSILVFPTLHHHNIYPLEPSIMPCTFRDGRAYGSLSSAFHDLELDAFNVNCQTVVLSDGRGRNVPSPV